MKDSVEARLDRMEREIDDVRKVIEQMVEITTNLMDRLVGGDE
jgi:hypothetical protein